MTDPPRRVRNPHEQERSLTAETPAPGGADGLLRVATYNLLHGVDLASGRVDLARAAASVADLDADVVAVQEVDRELPRSGGSDQVAQLAERAGLHGVFVPALLGDPDVRWRAVGETDAGGPAYGVGLLTRRPVVAARRIALPGGGDGQRRPGATPQRPGWDHEPRTAAAVTLALDGGVTLVVATTHLSYLPWRGVAQLRHLLAAMADAADALDSAGAGAAGAPAVVLGDLNLPAWGARLLARGGWRHAGGVPTYPAWRARVQLDHVLVHGRVTVRDVVAGERGPSDHLPLVATLAIG